MKCVLMLQALVIYSSLRSQPIVFWKSASSTILLENSRNRIIYIRQFSRTFNGSVFKETSGTSSLNPSFPVSPLIFLFLEFQCFCTSWGLVLIKVIAWFMVKPIDYLQKFSPRKENKEENNLKVLPWLLNFFNVICVEIKTLPVRSWHDVIRDMIDF